MIHAIISPEYIDLIKQNEALKDELCSINGIEKQGVVMMLRKQPNGLPHAQKLTNLVNLKTISDWLNIPISEMVEIVSND